MCTTSFDADHNLLREALLYPPRPSWVQTPGLGPRDFAAAVPLYPEPEAACTGPGKVLSQYLLDIYLCFQRGHGKLEGSVTFHSDRGYKEKSESKPSPGDCVYFPSFSSG